MSKYSAFNVAVQGEQMRNAQILSANLMRKAMASGSQEDVIAAEKAAKIQRHLEISFDDTLKEILLETGEVAS